MHDSGNHGDCGKQKAQLEQITKKIKKVLTNDSDCDNITMLRVKKRDTKYLDK